MAGEDGGGLGLRLLRAGEGRPGIRHPDGLPGGQPQTGLRAGRRRADAGALQQQAAAGDLRPRRRGGALPHLVGREGQQACVAAVEGIPPSPPFAKGGDGSVVDWRMVFCA
ncbi:hypothetical protein OF001_U180092 [Pseudomonas sp. OF001]|nr:hypothetical protein OF001_U180092 [Pseudomonas sp. OF001]